MRWKAAGSRDTVPQTLWLSKNVYILVNLLIVLYEYGTINTVEVSEEWRAIGYCHNSSTLLCHKMKKKCVYRKKKTEDANIVLHTRTNRFLP